MRTTIDIDTPIMRELKALQKRDGRSLGRLVSDLLAHALSANRELPPKPTAFSWTTASMGARIDLADTGAVMDSMDDAAA